MSFDAPERNAKFAASNDYRFELWTDTDRALAMHYGAARSPQTRMAGRVTVVLDAEARQVLDYRKFINVGVHPKDVLEDCQRRFGN